MSNWRVGEVQSVQDGRFAGIGFVLYDEDGRPCVLFGFSNATAAAVAQRNLKDALKEVVSVKALK
jgi:hypothetical protein